MPSRRLAARCCTGHRPLHQRASIPLGTAPMRPASLPTAAGEHKDWAMSAAAAQRPFRADRGGEVSGGAVTGKLFATLFKFTCHVIHHITFLPPHAASSPSTSSSFFSLPKLFQPATARHRLCCCRARAPPPPHASVPAAAAPTPARLRPCCPHAAQPPPHPRPSAWGQQGRRRAGAAATGTEACGGGGARAREQQGQWRAVAG
ncbi:hypothetical protein GUJ93_ZPchr0009g472 [Zizania palustris]|uniref:Uncharacterized protein n=1 Tax=Zizania palustris TaxID=103762 RepID=A0A8J5RXR4_ZIZPA|nr:hypothetical protein GUJ93_ZPchr0009g472 [Zizania palustris]